MKNFGNIWGILGYIAIIYRRDEKVRRKNAHFEN